MTEEDDDGEYRITAKGVVQHLAEEGMEPLEAFLECLQWIDTRLHKMELFAELFEELGLVERAMGEK